MQMHLYLVSLRAKLDIVNKIFYTYNTSKRGNLVLWFYTLNMEGMFVNI